VIEDEYDNQNVTQVHDDEIVGEPKQTHNWAEWDEKGDDDGNNEGTDTW